MTMMTLYDNMHGGYSEIMNIEKLFSHPAHHRSISIDRIKRTSSIRRANGSHASAAMM